MEGTNYREEQTMVFAEGLLSHIKQAFLSESEQCCRCQTSYDASLSLRYSRGMLVIHASVTWLAKYSSVADHT